MVLRMVYLSTPLTSHPMTLQAESISQLIRKSSTYVSPAQFRRLFTSIPLQPSQVGIELSSIAFNTYANGIEIAPVSSMSSVTLAPLSTSSLGLAGRLIPQNSAEGLATISAVFNNYIHGMDSQVTVYGASAGPSDVSDLLFRRY